MTRVKNENYVVIQGYMINELKLKGNELLVYAIIQGFSQSEGTVFSGSLQYLADWTNSTKQGVIKNLKSLQDKGLINKNERYINGVKFCEYYTTMLNRVLNNVEQGIQQSLTPPIKQSLPNNIEIHNIEQNKDIYIDHLEEWFEEFWSEYIKKVGKADAEKKFRKACTNEKTFIQIMEALRAQNKEVYSKRDKQYVPNPSTWLNQKRWEDEVIKESKGKNVVVEEMPEFIKNQIEGKTQSKKTASKELLAKIKSMQETMK